MAPSIDYTANLYCSEDVFGGASDDEGGSFCEGEEDYLDDYFPALLPTEQVEVDESIAVLVEKEGCHLPQADYLQRLQNKAIDARARQNAVRWLLKVRAHYNFGPLTAALSVNYLDRFLSRHQMPNGKAWMLQLLSVACLSLAAKMEETEVPLLLDLQVEGAEFVFEPCTIQRMELFVLSTLEWRMSSVTAFSYVENLILKLGFVREQDQRSLVFRVNDLILSSLKENSFLEYRPSSVASAAALCAAKELFPASFADRKKVLISRLPLKDSLDRCLHLMEEFFVEPFCLNLKRKAHCSATIPQSPLAVLDASFSCDSESTIRSIESSPSVYLVPSPATKKRRVDDFCTPIHLLEAV